MALSKLGRLGSDTAALDSANTTDASSRLSASVLFGLERCVAVLEGNPSLPQREAVISAAKQAGGVAVSRYVADADMIRSLYEVEAVALCQLTRAKDRWLFWENAAVHEIISMANRTASESNRHHNG